MTRIWERLFLGDIADTKELAASNPRRITTVLSLSETPVEARRASINYLHFPIEDGKPVSVRQFDRILDALSENIRWGTVLLHCARG
jgi:protein-tyrosine phosphatase